MRRLHVSKEVAILDDINLVVLDFGLGPFVAGPVSDIYKCNRDVVYWLALMIAVDLLLEGQVI